jgi:hypothetical protein
MVLDDFKLVTKNSNFYDLQRHLEFTKILAQSSKNPIPINYSECVIRARPCSLFPTKHTIKVNTARDNCAAWMERRQTATGWLALFPSAPCMHRGIKRELFATQQHTRRARGVGLEFYIQVAATDFILHCGCNIKAASQIKIDKSLSAFALMRPDYRVLTAESLWCVMFCVFLWLRADHSKWLSLSFGALTGKYSQW